MSALAKGRGGLVQALIILLLASLGCLGLTVHDGTFNGETNRDIIYWASTTNVSNAAWKDACLSLEYNGRRGRLGRIYTKEENDRVLALVAQYPFLGIDGSDSAVEGRWAWSDGNTFWEKDYGCTQKFCSWHPGQPDDFGGKEDTMEMLLAYKNWTDTAARFASVLCEFPCNVDADCGKDTGGDKWVCHQTTNRCVKESECSVYAPEDYSDGHGATGRLANRQTTRP
ncbi:hypothetical protein DIPPA_24568 [Diplonema papillatum]|nr:hypothetical protein DIPPA_24568 [Diplonema papillatum]